MAVTKTVDPILVNIAISLGIKVIGENRVQEFLEKEVCYNLKDATVHFIGTLQRNKVKYIVKRVQMIESVNSLKLAEEIDSQCFQNSTRMPVLIEVNVGNEMTKTGIIKEDLFELIESVSKLKNIQVKGLMAIPPYTTDYQLQRSYCAEMNKLFIDIKSKKIDNICMDCLSMGMSQDYIAAIEEGSTQIRLGTALFGTR